MLAFLGTKPELHLLGVRQAEPLHKCVKDGAAAAREPAAAESCAWRGQHDVSG